MVRYQPGVIQQYASALYDQADRVVAASSFAGGFVGSGIGWLFTVIALLPDAGFVTVIFLAAAGAGLGYFRGQKESFRLRLHAQIALCQVMTESNSRLLLEHLTADVSQVGRPSPSSGAPRR